MRVKTWEHISLLQDEGEGRTAFCIRMNELGNRGWELVSTCPYTTGYQLIAFFKREAGMITIDT